MDELHEKMKQCPWYGSTLDLALSFRGKSDKSLEELYPLSSYAWAKKEIKK